MKTTDASLPADCTRTSCDIKGDVDSNNPDDNVLMEWTTRSLNQPLREIILGPIIMILIPTLICLGVTWRMWGSIYDNLESWIAICCIAYGMFFMFLTMTRQKTVFNYKITKTGATVEYYLYFPNFASPLFKGSAIGIVLLFILTAIITESFIFMIGPVAMALGSARFLLNWKNEIKTRSTEWPLYNLLIVDRARLMIVASYQDETSVGFNMRLPNKRLFDYCLETLRKTLPNEIEFREERWPW